ncbi:fungal-specific transcription factor domain-containing protein [Phanerochaete sordida]|uniref:Fungal-specific transcription factor domain-containing protein n=1 Tax=Phanerochaete sordida TaxID=48140 RepID=A0A9P3LKF3_9APHY|nr:fungal-specific transcription factor domain-containing protein [Phanerochaete sordida]
MEYDYEVDLQDNDQRPLKRPRQRKEGDDGHRPYNPQSGPSGVHLDVDDHAETSARKGRKRPLSCGECRRLKLKCDRVFPCQSCRKRGCAEICPEGALTGGKGSRFILANTEQLHDKIKTMSERIQQLEDALRSSNTKLSPAEHPLLRQELLLIKKSPELFGIDQQMMVHDTTPERRTEDQPRTSPAVSSKDGEEYATTSNTPVGQHYHSRQPEISPELARLSRSFPSPWSICFELDLDMRQRLRDMLPRREDAEHLCEQARRNAFWQHQPDASETFLPNLIHSVYTTSLPALLPHRLGLFLMVLAIGTMVDLRHGPDRHKAEMYHNLARAALCEVPLMDDTSLDAVNALFFMEWYLLTFSDNKKALEYAWGIMGLATRLAYSIGIHRDGVRSKLIPEESDKRRTLFWDLVGADARLALMLRRPPSVCMRNVDARQPAFNGDSPDAQYHHWQYSFLAHCMLPVLDRVTSTQPTGYTEILGLDNRVRNFDVPPMLQMVDNDRVTTNEAMQQAMTACTREIALLHLHRNYFTQALTSSQEFSIKHRYAPSVLAVYSSACKLIWTVDALYSWEPALSSRFMVFWSNCFSAACALCFLVSRAPSLGITPRALQELDKVLTLFKDVGDHVPKVASYLHILDKLVARGREHYVNWRGGVHTANDETNDEICQLARRIVPPAGDGFAPADASLADPFEYAHPHLRRCLDQATAADPCLPSGFHLTRIRGPVGAIMHAQSDVRSYSAPGELAGRAGGLSWSAGGSRAGYGSDYAAAAAALGADIADSSWMSWL